MTGNVLDAPEAITALLQQTHRIAVLGIRTDAHADQPGYYVPKYLVEAGFDVVPVPLYYPEATTILGRPVFRSLAEVPPPPIDMVNVFQRSKDLPAHLDELLKVKPKSVWLQKGIKDQAFAERLGNAGIKVVQDRCLMVELKERPGLRR